MGVYQDPARSNKAAKAMTGFYIHLAAYAVVNVLLVSINLATNPDRLWFQWPLAGWGVGVLAHAAAVFAFAGRHRRRA